MHSHDMTLPHLPLEDPTFDLVLGVEEDLQVDQCIQNTGTQSQQVAGDRITANSVPLVSVGTGQSPG
jgi:hypothetical protein